MSPATPLFSASGIRTGMEEWCMAAKSVVKCPYCGSQRAWKDGIRYTRFGEVQRYLCRDCGYRFSC